MSDEPKERSLIRRILLALDATTGAASLEAAIEIAARLRADVVALFLEDEELLRVSDYPHSRHINFPTGDYERVSGNTLARQIRSIASTVEETLNRATRRLGVTVSFQVARGSVQQELESRAHETDLIFVDRDSNTFTRHTLVGGPSGGLIETVSQSILVWRSPTGHHGPVLAVLGGNDEPTRLLAAADRLGGDAERDLIVLLDSSDPGVRARLRGVARDWLETHQRSASFYRLDRGTASDLEQALRGLGAELVVVSASRSRGSDMLSEWIETTERPVFLVR